MRRLIITCLTLVAAALLVLPAAASAAPKKRAKASTPQITRVQPMRISVGGTLTIKGRNFKAGRTKNTVIFRSPEGRTAFAKPRRASRTKLVLTVPASVSRLLDVANNDQQPTRLKLRVLAGKFSKFTPRRLSPVVTGAGDGDGTPGGGPVEVCNSDADHDNDLLPNSTELAIGLDPCLDDTDTDGVNDGYEYQSALDLNHYPRTAPLPYPGKRPYPNPLDPTDGVPFGTDYDGDGISLREEYGLWLTFAADGVRRTSPPAALSNLLYSDGLQKSIDSPPPAAPPEGTLLNYVLDQQESGLGYGELSDDERDADGDGLGNWDELHGRMTEAWWPAQHDGVNEPKESKYPGIDFLDIEDTAPFFNAHIDPDMDGDGVLDGADDADHDGLSNQFEVRRPDDWEDDAIVVGDNPWAYVNPFNPCKPFNSERCHSHPPFGHYDSDGAPPVGPDPPAGYPGTHPETPEG